MAVRLGFTVSDYYWVKQNHFLYRGICYIEIPYSEIPRSSKGKIPTISLHGLKQWNKNKDSWNGDKQCKDELKSATATKKSANIVEPLYNGHLGDGRKYPL